MDTVAKLVSQGRPVEALAELKTEVRNRPSDVELRVLLFALNCVLGNWEKARADLDAVLALDPSWIVPARVYQQALRAEADRAAVFAGVARPLVMGEPPEWLAWNVQGISLTAQGKSGEASGLHRQAFELAPEYACRVDDRACAWLSDADRRLGPVLETYLEGKYYWIPFGQLRRIELTAPEFLVETVWVPATLTVAGGAELAVQLPARYPGSERSTDGELCLGRRTGASQPEGPADFGGLLGQKQFESEADHFAMLDCKVIEFTHSP